MSVAEVQGGALWQLLSRCLVHLDDAHLLGNLAGLLLLGAPVARALGGQRALIVATAGALASGAGLLLRPPPEIWSVGLPGVSFGLLGALFALALRPRGRLSPGFVAELRGALLLVAAALAALAAWRGPPLGLGLLAGGAAALALPAGQAVAPPRPAVDWRPLAALAGWVFGLSVLIAVGLGGVKGPALAALSLAALWRVARGTRGPAPPTSRAIRRAARGCAALWALSWGAALLAGQPWRYGASAPEPRPLEGTALEIPLAPELAGGLSEQVGEARFYSFGDLQRDPWLLEIALEPRSERLPDWPGVKLWGFEGMRALPAPCGGLRWLLFKQVGRLEARQWLGVYLLEGHHLEVKLTTWRGDRAPEAAFEAAEAALLAGLGCGERGGEPLVEGETWAGAALALAREGGGHSRLFNTLAWWLSLCEGVRDLEAAAALSELALETAPEGLRHAALSGSGAAAAARGDFEAAVQAGEAALAAAAGEDPETRRRYRERLERWRAGEAQPLECRY
jgi:membrane associated rhomboid family serine protease